MEDTKRIAEELGLEFASEDDSALDVPDWAIPPLERFQQLRAQYNASVLRGDWHGLEVEVFDRVKSIEWTEWGPDAGEFIHLTCAATQIPVKFEPITIAQRRSGLLHPESWWASALWLLWAKVRRDAGEFDDPEFHQWYAVFGSTAAERQDLLTPPLRTWLVSFPGEWAFRVANPWVLCCTHPRLTAAGFTRLLDTLKGFAERLS
jgi:hypothetical protein